jgi:hypothetical protein
MEKVDEDDRLCVESRHAVDVFGEACETLRDNNPFVDFNPLRTIIRSLLIDLRRRRFSQGEIDTAVLAALGDMDRCSPGGDAGRPRRSTI